MAATPLKEQLAAALAAFAPSKQTPAPDLFAAGVGLFTTLGYDTSRQARLPDNSARGFVADFVGPTDAFSAERARTGEWKTVELLFQLTQAEVINQVSLFDTRQVDRTRIETYLFWAIELTGDGYTRTDLAQMTRELNRLFPMPCLALFRYGDCLTLAAIDRRLHKRDESRDVLAKVTLVKSIRLHRPHPGHLAILHDLSFGELYQRHHFDSFVALHRAWQQTLDIALLNKKFYRELYTWYEWAAHPESGVHFPRPASETAGLSGPELAKSEDAYRRLSLIRLLTRVIFVWFLREKDLVPDALFDTKKTLPATLKNFRPADPDSSAYYQGILQNLFFATLNTPMKRDVAARASRGEDVVDEIRRFVVVEEKGEAAGKSKGKGSDLSDDHTDQTKYRGEELFADPAAALALFDTVPFLNGGLFECLDTREEGKEIRFDGFSTKAKKRATVPNVLFFGEKKGLDLVQAFGGDKKQRQVNAQGLVVILEKYKFTIAENTPLEEEVALDPELLGKVFENLLATYNPETQTTARKQTGSFYTPREIVNYMVDESLKAYLAQALPADPAAPGPAAPAAPDERLAQLFDEGRPDTENPFGADSPDTVRLVDALSRCRILDPACGSGAFPMGVLHRMVTLLRRLDPDNRRWRQTQLDLAENRLADAKKETDPEVRQSAVQAADQHMQVVLDSFRKDAEAAALTNTHLTEAQRRQNYARKLFLIENCIYGVDIQQIAVQIAKLRFFISLVAEQRVDDSQENRNILAMPNLETKFVAANTLVPLDESVGSKSGINLGTGMFEHTLVKQRERELQDLRRQLFFVRSYPAKKRLRIREKAKRQELSEALLLSGLSEKSANQVSAWSSFDVMHSASYFDAETMFDVKEGFDVVIGNPPYGAVNDAVLKKSYAATYESFKRNCDIYVAFYHNAVRLCKTGGVLTYITPNTFLNGDYFEVGREILTKSFEIREIMDFKESKVFQDPTVFVCIFHALKIARKPTGMYEAKLKVWDAISENFINNVVEIEPASKKALKGESAIFEQITNEKNIGFIGEYFLVKDVGFNYWSVGKGKKRDGNSIGDRIFYSGIQESKKDLPYLKGKDVSKFAINEPTNYLRHDFEDYLDEVDVFRYNGDILHVSPKLIYRQTASSIIASIDTKENLVDKTVHVIVPNQAHSFDLKYICALLNSKLYKHLYQYVSQETEGRTFSQVKTTYVKKIPFKKEGQAAQLPFIRLVEYILWLKAQHSADVRAQYLEQVIDGLVYELYFPAALAAAGCEVGRHLPALGPLPAGAGDAEEQIQDLYAEIEAKDHPVRKSLFLMDTVAEVAIVEGKRK